jgi:hypothetical protein
MGFSQAKGTAVGPMATGGHLSDVFRLLRCCVSAAAESRAGQQRKQGRRAISSKGVAYHFREQAKVSLTLSVHAGAVGAGTEMGFRVPARALRLRGCGWRARRFRFTFPARSLRVGVSAAGPACIAPAPCVDSDSTGCDFPQPRTLRSPLAG